MYLSLSLYIYIYIHNLEMCGAVLCCPGGAPTSRRNRDVRWRALFLNNNNNNNDNKHIFLYNNNDDNVVNG